MRREGREEGKGERAIEGASDTTATAAIVTVPHGSTYIYTWL